MDTAFIHATSVIVEALFSKSGHIFGDRRSSTTPEHIEEQIFLKENRELWDVDSVQLIFNQIEKENKDRSKRNNSIDDHSIANHFVPLNNNNGNSNDMDVV